jgi:hypothetical protein
MEFVKNTLFNEITHTFVTGPDPVKRNSVGFDVERGKPTTKGYVREYKKGNLFLFNKVVNREVYTREAALKILGACILTEAGRLRDGVDIDCMDSSNIYFNIDLVKIWKSENSHLFLLAETRIKNINVKR